MIRNARQVRPSGQVDGAAVNNSVDAMERSAGIVPSTSNPPPFDQVGFAWASTPPDVQRTLVATMLTAIGLLSFDQPYQLAVIAEINRRMALAHQHPTYLMMSMTCAEWVAKTPGQKLIKIGDYFATNNVSYLYVRPVDYPVIASALDAACPAPMMAPPLPASTPVPTPGFIPPPLSPPPATSPAIVRVTVTTPSPPLPGDLSVMIGSSPMHRVSMGIDEPDGQNTFESDPLSMGPSTIVVTGTGVVRASQSVTVASGTTTAPSIMLTIFCPPTPAASSFTSAADRQNWVDQNRTCPAPDPWVAPAAPPPAPPPASSTPDATPPPPDCPAPPTSWATESDRTAWINAHSTCPPPTPWCPPLPASFASEGDRQAWIDAHASCSLPGPYCPPPPTTWAVEADRTAWINAHANCPAPGPWCPPLPASFATAADRQAWIDAHSTCPLPVAWTAAPVVAKKSSGWAWFFGIVTVVGGGIAYAKHKEKTAQKPKLHP